MNSNQIKTKRIRAISASQSRPFSGSSRQGHKTEFIENVYNAPGISTNRRQPISLITTKDQQHKYKKLMPTRQSKQYEQYFQQIMHLKSTVNKLNDIITTQKTKIQTLEKRNNKYDKQMKMEFEKQIYWTGTNTHMITGIKSSYDALKAKYEQKCKQYDKISKQIQYTQTKQFKIYAENLQSQNNRLIERLDMLLQSVNKPIHSNKKQISQYLLLDLQKKSKRLEQQLKHNISLLKTANQQIKDRDKKIMFLEKLIIEKDNAQYHSHKKAKKFQKERFELSQEAQKLKMQLTNERQILEGKIDQMRDTYQSKIAKQKQIFEATIQEKDNKIVKIEKELTYLSTLLAYKKPNQESKDISQKLITEERSNKQDNFFLGNALKESLIKQRKNSTRVVNHEEDILAINKALALQIDQQSYRSQPKKRIQQTAIQRHSEAAQKKRKVTFEELKDISQLLKYKFIAHGLDIQEVKKYFAYPKRQRRNRAKSSMEENIQEQQNSNQQELQQEENWKEQYVTMKELIDILKEFPFGVTQENAILISRYMVEDSPNDYVYCDFDNEERRSIVKSIIKALTGQYQIPAAQQREILNKQCDTVLKMYETNLLAALKAVASSGYISQRKFSDLISSLGIQISDQAKEIIIGRLAVSSQNLNKLNYSVLWAAQ